MFRLVRMDKEPKGGVDKEIEAKAALREIPMSRDQIPAVAWRNCSPTEKKTWKDFVNNGRVNPGTVPAPILESWTRCLKAEVEYAGGRCQDILSARDLEKRLNQLVEVTDPLLEALHHCLRGLGFVVVLIDHDGYILKSAGDVHALRQAEKINFGPGANWSENSVGTNAIGTALTLGRSIQVTGPEHYNDGHHLWTCAATPIRDASGRLAGCLDISGPREYANFPIQEMTMSGVRFIEKRLRQEHDFSRMARYNAVMNAAVDCVADCVVSVNNNGIIDGLNQSASRMLCAPPNDILGRMVEATPLSPALNPGQGRDPNGIGVVTLNTRYGPRQYQVKARSIKDDYGDDAGSVITLSSVPQKITVRAEKNTYSAHYTFEALIGQSPEIIEVMEQAKLAAASPSTILIQGESGTGKEIFAQAVHNASPRGSGPFVSINCGAIPKELIQSELFGYSEGAFTGARKGGRRGKLELAAGGTIFLDEISEMPLDMQVNLLTVLENKTFVPVGGNKPISPDLRVIAATNRSLVMEVKKGRFREDLYYRLNVVGLNIPPLRDRGRDVGLLADHYLKRLACKLGKPVPSADQAFRQALNAYHWPGNVRELINILEQAINFAPDGLLKARHLPSHLKPGVISGPVDRPGEILPLSALEKQAIKQALEKCQGNISQVARALGIGRNTLYSKMKKYGLKTI